ncbi:hypothetical protein HMPREF1550_00442 [Actinomyces sp. oral taxon 877 str. F0543]|nr:hypothetical protein HMPREF1550_00442 [Actinomyces sp. oral taxon 877 str. F0543]
MGPPGRSAPGRGAPPVLRPALRPCPRPGGWGGSCESVRGPPGPGLFV